MDVTATEFKQKMGRYLDEAERDPVIIKKSGREKSVLLSINEYNRLMAMEDAYWAQQAKQAETEGFLGKEETEKLLRRIV